MSETNSEAPQQELKRNLDYPDGFNQVGMWELHDTSLSPKKEQSIGVRFPLRRPEPKPWPDANYDEYKYQLDYKTVKGRHLIKEAPYIRQEKTYVTREPRYVVEGSGDLDKISNFSSGMSKGCRAWDTKLGRLVFLKFFDSSLFDAKDRAVNEQAFQNEAQITDRVKGAPKVYDFFKTREFPSKFRRDPNVTDEVSVMVMEYIPPERAQTLSSLVREKQAAHEEFPVDQILEIVFQVAAILDENAGRFGENKIVHKDLKPSNVMVSPTRDKSPFVLDYGLAQDIHPGHSGRVVGTPHYISPDQVMDLGETPLTPVSDIYSLGVAVLEMLTYVNLHDPEPDPDPDKKLGAQEVAVNAIWRKKEEHLLPILDKRFPVAKDRDKNGNLSERYKNLVKVFEEVFALMPEKRFQTASKFAVALEKALEPFINPQPEKSAGNFNVRAFLIRIFKGKSN